jgi:hypothetical protein
MKKTKKTSQLSYTYMHDLAFGKRRNKCASFTSLHPKKRLVKILF